jgi:hypothetical protein
MIEQPFAASPPVVVGAPFRVAYKRLLVDAVIVAVALVAAFLIRFDGQIPPAHVASLARATAILAPLYLSINYLSRAHRQVCT